MSMNLIPTKRISESDLFDYIVELVGKHAETLDQSEGFLDAWEQSIANIRDELDQVGGRECDLYIKGRKEKPLRKS